MGSSTPASGNRPTIDAAGVIFRTAHQSLQLPGHTECAPSFQFTGAPFPIARRTGLTYRRQARRLSPFPHRAPDRGPPGGRCICVAPVQLRLRQPSMPSAEGHPRRSLASKSTRRPPPSQSTTLLPFRAPGLVPISSQEITTQETSTAARRPANPDRRLPHSRRGVSLATD